MINGFGARAVVVSAALCPLAEAGAPRTPGVAVWLAFGGHVTGHGSYARALAATPPTDQPRGADMLGSAGTTGRPKGVKSPLPDRQVHEPGDVPAALFGPRNGFGPDTVHFSPAPVRHAAARRFGGVVHAYDGTVVMMRGFEAERLPPEPSVALWWGSPPCLPWGTTPRKVGEKPGRAEDAGSVGSGVE